MGGSKGGWMDRWMDGRMDRQMDRDNLEIESELFFASFCFTSILFEIGKPNFFTSHRAAGVSLTRAYSWEKND